MLTKPYHPKDGEDLLAIPKIFVRKNFNPKVQPVGTEAITPMDMDTPKPKAKTWARAKLVCVHIDHHRNIPSGRRRVWAKIGHKWVYLYHHASKKRARITRHQFDEMERPNE